MGEFAALSEQPDEKKNPSLCYPHPETLKVLLKHDGVLVPALARKGKPKQYFNMVGQIGSDPGNYPNAVLCCASIGIRCVAIKGVPVIALYVRFVPQGPPREAFNQLYTSLFLRYA